MNAISGQTLRLAVPGDVAAVRAMVRCHCREETPDMPVSEIRIGAAVDLCMQHGGVVVSCDGTDPVGTIGMTVDAPFWSDEPWLIGLWAYVQPAHRRAPHMRSMLQAVLREAEHRHLPLRWECWRGRSTAGKYYVLRREFGEPGGTLFFAKG